jgi:cytochrome c-type biogenesis protein CcmE
VKPRDRRAIVIGGGLAAIAIAAALILNALNSNIALFVTPSDVIAGKAPHGRAFRIGGLVKAGSMHRDNLTVHFVVTDLVQNVPVSYTGILPDLFQEGKGAVIQGKLEANGEFIASEVLAKHDENYMPPEAKQALDKAQQGKTGNTP